MTDRIKIELTSPAQAARELTQGPAWAWIKAMLTTGRRLNLEVSKDTRSSAQNRILWSCLNDISRQVEWHGQKLDSDSWKDMATAALKRQKVVPGIDGGYVVLGQRTSRMTRAELAELVDFLHAFGDQHDVSWSPTSLGREWDLAA
jgi:hypothetical protein